MTLYIARRLVWTLIVVACVLAITFAVFYLLPAGDPALRFAGKNPTDAEIAQIHHRLGLDQPWYVQFGKFSWHFFTGDKYGWPGLGYTYRERQLGQGPDRRARTSDTAPDRRSRHALADRRRRDRGALGGETAIGRSIALRWGSPSSASRRRSSGSA